MEDNIELNSHGIDFFALMLWLNFKNKHTQHRQYYSIIQYVLRYVNMCHVCT